MKTSLLNNLTTALLLLICSVFIAPSALAQDHLLLTEITLAPDSGEFIEIYNPTAISISLDNYYLADSQEYAKIASGTATVINSDFIVRFPSGYNIIPNQVMVVAVKGDLFTSYYGMVPDFEIVNQSASVPDMDTIHVGISPTLTNAGEGVVLFYWDGLSDLVSDVDIINAGIPTTANQITSKTGLVVNASTYLNDAGTMPQQMSTPGIGFSTKRILLEGSHETQTGGNGITGNDETTENILVTWDSAYTAPNPGIVTLITGVNPIDFSENILLYPNPSTGKFNINLPMVKSDWNIQMVNIIGESVYYDFVKSTSSHITFNLEGITPGIYFLHLKNNENIIIKKLVIQ
ncbi:MAG: T9SS type A sorting domain-containing protein [Bacteroidia bacterium]